MSLLLQVTTTQASPFFSNDFAGWLKVLGLLGGIILAVWGMLKGKLQSDINGVGDRVKELEKAKERDATSITRLELDLREGRGERNHMQAQIGEIRKAQENLSETLGDMQVNIIGEIQKTRDAIFESTMRLRERIVRLETVGQIEVFLGKRLPSMADKENG